MKIKIGEHYTFTKSGNEVRAIAPVGKAKSTRLWEVERVDGDNAGKRMLVNAETLVRINE